MEKKDWREELNNYILSDHHKLECSAFSEGLDCCLEHQWVLDFIQQEIDRDREEEREKVLMIVSVVLMANFGNGANELMQIIKSKLTK